MTSSRRQQFESASGANEFLITHARDIRTGKRVYLSSDMFKPGGKYYNDVEDKGHLICGDEKCPARIQVKTPRAGDKGPREHFATVPGETHVDHCSMRKPTPVNPAFGRGAEIVIEDEAFAGIVPLKMRTQFERASYTHGERTRGTLRALDENLRYLEIIKVKSIEHIIQIMRTRSAAYINNSVISFAGLRAPWRRFMLPSESRTKLQTGMRLRALVSEMISEGQKFMPVMMEIIPKHPYQYYDFDQKPWVLSRTFESRSRGPTDIIKPRLFIHTQDKHVTDAFSNGERGLVAGLAMIRRDEHDILLDVAVSDPRWFSRELLSDIAKENNKYQKSLAL